MSSRAFDIQYPYNILRAEGYEPTMAAFPYQRETVEDVDNLKKHFRHYFEIFSDLGPETEKLINDYLDSASENGKVRDATTGTLGVIHWKTG